MCLYGTVDDNTPDFILIYLFFSVSPCESVISYRDMGNDMALAVPSGGGDAGELLPEGQTVPGQIHFDNIAAAESTGQ